jgi:4-diphosphocytidyl-2-C-methyl-D-erythritol kinase
MKSNAKINLSLEIVGRESEFHTLNTVMCILEDYYDEIEIIPSKSFQISSCGEYQFEGENILSKVADLFKKEFGGNTNFNVSITKNIKTGGGLGGGSSNAGAFLKFLLSANSIFLSQKAFSNFAIQIGADVAFFYNNLPKICTHYGEVLQDIPFKMPQNLFALVILPSFKIETKQAFSLVKPHHLNHNSSFKTFDDVLFSKNPLGVIAIEINPELSDIVSKLKTLPNVMKADVSGSGSSCFALFPSQKDAKNAQNLILNYKTIISKIF